mgnify:CR=1 FL=1
MCLSAQLPTARARQSFEASAWPIVQTVLMNKILLILLIALGLTACLEQPSSAETTPPAADRTQVQADLEAVQQLVADYFADIWSGLDSTQLRRYHTRDYILLENGVVWTEDSILHFIRREQKEVAVEQYERLNRFEFHRSVHNQQSVWVAYDNYGTWVKDGDTLFRAQWLESAVAVKENGQWKFQQLHSTRVRK